MTADNELEIQEAFQRAQKAHHNKAKLVATLKNRYIKLEDKSEFHEEFLRCLKYAMIVYTREPAVENVIDFVVKFAVSFETPVSEEEEVESDEDDGSFLHFLLNFLLESHTANSHAVRFRVCQLINKLLGSLSENAQIDDEICEQIHEAMLIRVTDKYPNVRIQAALAMARLQDPNDPECPTIKAYMLLLENDSNAEVRRAVLSCIAPSAFTLSKIFKRTRDIKEKVRKLAYQVLAEKVHIRALTIAQRVSLLQHGLNDSAESVKEVVKVCLLPAWLRLLQNDVLQLLHRLDVENCAETAVLALHALFSTATTLDDLLQNGAKLDERKLIPVDALTCENVLYWRAACEFVKAKGDEGEELLEKLLPEPAIFAEYLYSYLKSVPLLSEEQRADMTQLELVMTKEFIGQQLILLVGCLDTTEEGGRRRVLAVLKEMLLLPNTPLSLIGQLVQKLVGILHDDQQRITVMAEIISDLREPIVPITECVDENEKRKKQVKLAELKVCIMECKQELEDCISREDFARAAELKESIAQLEERRGQLELEPEQDHTKEQRVEKSRVSGPEFSCTFSSLDFTKNDPETLLKCLTMCAEVLKQMNINRGICPTITALIESLILPSVSNSNSAVRNMAVVCLGTAALHSNDLANTHLVLLLQITQLDEPKIRISALKALIDQLLLNGLKILQDKPSDLLDSDGQSEEEESPVQNILKMLSEFLDSEICELRTETAEGLAKLMYCGRIVSAKLLSRLVLLWYNPVTEEDQRLRHCLGVFLQLYARESRAHQECVEESFLPTMRTLFNAPATSPLSEIDTSNVAELFIELTRPSALVQPSQGVCVHDSLAVRVCNEILRDIEAPEVRLYCKTLSGLEISTEPGPANQELQQLLSQILQEVKDKFCVRAVEKVLNQLKGSQQSKPSAPQDTVLTAVDENGSSGAVNEDETKSKRPRRGTAQNGQKKVSTAKTSKKSCENKEKSDESDEENIPEAAPPSVRPTRRAKAAALEKTKQDLTALMNREASS
ncbi:condensin complex subunit 3 isoform X1 [Colossoma macropomum]|uniref:condensin complex subunit 3 isoform X1 n=1 Tax=Colossoma macropomum TaxID=42526 RepID=UPI00186425E7|nr:condensin complex subunit 3 isoform X1 [Colossoma macropomum]XP_036444770.1 condensin complex subunit 3 isoform X1 [Colossoma macropomum]